MGEDRENLLKTTNLLAWKRSSGRKKKSNWEADHLGVGAKRPFSDLAGTNRGKGNNSQQISNT